MSKAQNKIMNKNYNNTNNTNITLGAKNWFKMFFSSARKQQMLPCIKKKKIYTQWSYLIRHHNLVFLPIRTDFAPGMHLQCPKNFLSLGTEHHSLSFTHTHTAAFRSSWLSSPWHPSITLIFQQCLLGAKWIYDALPC